ISKTFTLEHGSIDEHHNKKENLPKTKVRIQIDKNISKYIKGSKKYYGFVSEEVKKDKVEMTFMVSDPRDGFPRWYMMFGDYAKILEPDSLKERVKELLKKTEAMLN